MSDAHLKVLMRSLRDAYADACTAAEETGMYELIRRLGTEFAYFDTEFDLDAFEACIYRGANKDGSEYVW